MARKKLATELRQEQILAAALEIVSAKGLRGLNMGAVARRVGIVPSALYRHFRDKEEILDGLLGLIEERLLAHVEAARQEAACPLTALEVLLKRHVGLIRENAGIPQVVFSEEVYGANSQRKARVYAILTRYLGEVEDLFAEAQCAGLVDPDLAPGDLSVMFLGLVQPAAILWHVSDGGFDVTRLTDRAWRVFTQAIRGGL
ncbi:MAG TPA: TetR/AcrR family transcriptional regulator [Candidatus Hydrogenedentes bacterium]|jgi:AcrR family transcriptional regulator|nr:TetR/AcrR family transcriptional regulator [Candidatus Hydrogenedentota bacterium]HPJ97920.1 TetR/AcrR family transcriptional regulator [Candidatus Hydrogenedentota bacterium]